MPGLDNAKFVCKNRNIELQKAIKGENLLQYSVKVTCMTCGLAATYMLNDKGDVVNSAKKVVLSEHKLQQGSEIEVDCNLSAKDAAIEPESW